MAHLGLLPAAGYRDYLTEESPDLPFFPVTIAVLVGIALVVLVVRARRGGSDRRTGAGALAGSVAALLLGGWTLLAPVGAGTPEGRTFTCASASGGWFTYGVPDDDALDAIIQECRNRSGWRLAGLITGMTTATAAAFVLLGPAGRRPAPRSSAPRRSGPGGRL